MKESKGKCLHETGDSAFVQRSLNAVLSAVLPMNHIHSPAVEEQFSNSTLTSSFKRHPLILSTSITALISSCLLCQLLSLDVQTSRDIFGNFLSGFPIFLLSSNLILLYFDVIWTQAASLLCANKVIPCYDLEMWPPFSDLAFLESLQDKKSRYFMFTLPFKAEFSQLLIQHCNHSLTYILK